METDDEQGEQDDEKTNLLGFWNPSMSSCYIDSLLLAMFGHYILYRPDPTDGKANFWTIMLYRTLKPEMLMANFEAQCNVAELVCSNDPVVDWERRQQIQDLFLSILLNMTLNFL